MAAQTGDLVRLWASIHRRLCLLGADASPSVAEELALIHDAFVEAEGPLGDRLRSGILPRSPSQSVHALDRDFPSPLVHVCDREGLLRSCVQFTVDAAAVTPFTAF